MYKNFCNNKYVKKRKKKKKKKKEEICSTLVSGKSHDQLVARFSDNNK
jgi:hypothetical protein